MTKNELNEVLSNFNKKYDTPEKIKEYIDNLMKPIYESEFEYSQFNNNIVRKRSG